MSEAARRKGTEGPGWIATLGGAAILVVLGFGVGLVAGAAWEEPDLVMDHFAGRTTEVPLLAEDGFGSEPAPVEEVAKEAPRRLLGSGEPAALEPVSSRPPSRGGHAIQVGAFGDRKGAESLVAELQKAGFDVYVLEDTGGSARFKVRVGPVAERAEAEKLAASLKQDHRLPTWILSRDGR